MRKIICSLIILAVFLAVAVIPTYAEAESGRLVDMADLLTSNEEADLLSKLDEISNRQQLDVVVVTVETLDGKTPEAYADDFYDYNGYGFGDSYDGILLLISMEDRDYYMTTTGFGITAFTDAGLEYIADSFLWDLGEGYYADAFEIFADQCDRFITQAKTGAPYDVDNMPEEPFEPVITFFMCLIPGFIVALIAVTVMRFQLKTVRPRNEAKNYVVNGSMNLTRTRDLFLYKTLDVRAIPRDEGNGGRGGSSTHTSSSGRTHGGGGGKF